MASPSPFGRASPWCCAPAFTAFGRDFTSLAAWCCAPRPGPSAVGRVCFAPRCCAPDSPPALRAAFTACVKTQGRRGSPEGRCFTSFGGEGEGAKHLCASHQGRAQRAAHQSWRFAPDLTCHIFANIYGRENIWQHQGQARPKDAKPRPFGRVCFAPWCFAPWCFAPGRGC